MARTVKTIQGITRPYYMRYAGDRSYLPPIPRFNEYPLPDAPLFSDCGKINELYRPHINGVLSVLLDRDLWAGNEWQKDTAQQLIYRLMEWLYECEDENEMPQLRQSPNDPCVLEQLVNGVWITAFDYGLCLKSSIPAVPTDVIAENVAPIIQASQEAFDAIEASGLAVEYPNAENSPSDPQNAPKNAILCLAIREYLTKLADFIQAMAQSANEPNEPNFGQLLVDWGTTIGTGVSLATAIFFPIASAPAWLINTARVGAGASFLYTSARTANTTRNFVDDVRQAYFDDGVNPVVIDDDTRNELICMMYDSLKDKPLTQANFNDALGNFPESTTVQQALKNITNWLFLTNVSYGEFVMVYNQLYLAQQTGAEYQDNDCGCVDPELECGINYNWSTWDATPLDVTFFESYPITAPPVQVAYYPATPFVSHSPFVINTPKTIYQVYELPCNKGISAVWGRLNTNSASAFIETYDGTEWVVRATQSISVGTVINFRLTLSWANTEGIVYQGARVKVITPAPLIDTFRIGL